MDLLDLATQKNENEGKWFQLEIYDSLQNYDVLIYGNDSDIVKKYQKEQLRKMDQKKNRKGELTEEAIDDLFDSKNESTLIKFGGIRIHDKPNEKVKLGGVEVENTKSSLAKVLKEIPAIGDFVNEKAKERENFLDDRKKN